MALSDEDKREITKLVRAAVQASGTPEQPTGVSLEMATLPADMKMQDLDQVLLWVKQRLPRVAEQCCNGCD